MLWSAQKPAALAVFLIALFTPAAGWSQDARSLLNSVAQNYQNISRYQLSVQTETTHLSELNRSWNKEYLNFAADGNGRYRYESKSSMEWVVVTSDGVKEWAVHPSSNEYAEKLVSASAKPSLPLRGRSPAFASKRLTMEAKHRLKRLATLHEKIRSAELLDPELIHVQGQSLRCLVVKVSYDPPARWKNENFFQETILWIDPQTKLVRKEHTVERGAFMSSRPQAHSIVDRITVFDLVRLGSQLPETMFSFTPTAESRLVDEFSPPGVTVHLLNQPAPPLKLKTLEGKELEPDQLRGKVLLVDFWATWCSPCLKQMAIIAKLHSELKDRELMVVGVNKDEDPKVAAAYLEKNDYAWLNLFDEKYQASKLWGAEAIPIVAIVDRAGKVVFVRFGTAENDEVEIRNALAKADPAFSK